MNTKAFTLIEIIMYLALFAVLMGGALTFAYQIMESSGDNQAKNLVQEEGMFLQAKIVHMVINATSVDVPVDNRMCGDHCVLMIKDIDGDSLELEVRSNNMILTRNESLPEILNSSLVTVKDFSVEYDSSKIQASFTVVSTTQQGKFVSEVFKIVQQRNF